MTGEAHHPAYFDVRFRLERYPDDWPEHFAIITAWATTGQQWSAADNAAANERLHQRLAALGCWSWQVTGFSPIDGHAEEGWAVALSAEQARELGREFLQDAIYWVDHDQLWVTKCTEASGLVTVGSFRQRIEVQVGRE